MFYILSAKWAGTSKMEYIDEWPPPAPKEESPARDDGGGGKACKRPRLGTREHSFTRGEKGALVCANPTVKADTLLARWWKEKVKEKHSLPLAGSKSANPKTNLFHISR